MIQNEEKSNQIIINSNKQLNPLENRKTQENNDLSSKNLTNYFRECKDEYLYIEFKSQNQVIHVIKNVLDEWKNVDIEKIEIKEISGAGGSKTYCVFIDDISIQEYFRKLVFHERILDPEDPLTDVRMLDAQKSLWKHNLTIPRIISGRNWYIEPFIEKSEQKFDNFFWASMTAKMHQNVVGDWYDAHRNRLIKKYPVLKNAHYGSHIWYYTTRVSCWFQQNEDYHDFWINAGFEPLSEAGKRLTTGHNDIHIGNILVDNKMKPYFIDLEFTTTQWAANDLSYIFEMTQFGCDTVDGRLKFCKKYLEELGLPSSREDVELLIFDAQCQRLRCCWTAKLLEEIELTKANPSYNFKLYKLYEEFELKSRSDKGLIKKIAESDFFDVAAEECKEIAQINEINKKERAENCQMMHTGKKRSRITYDEENLMHEFAFDKGVVRLETETTLTWEDANKMAHKYAGGLCTKKEIIDAGIKMPDDSDLWIYVIRNDEVKVDALQIGTRPHPRYISFYDTMGFVKFSLNNQPEQWRPIDFIYAKRCKQKNPKYYSLNLSRENQILETYNLSNQEKFEKIAEKQCLERRRFFTYDQEINMLKNAYEKGVIRLYIDKCVSWKEAKKIAEAKASRLPTLEELEGAGVKESDETDFWTYIERDDKKPDAVQLGIQPYHTKERYISYVDKAFSFNYWLTHNIPTDERPTKYIYAKKCPEKNKDFEMPCK